MKFSEVKPEARQDEGKVPSLGSFGQFYHYHILPLVVPIAFLPYILISSVPQFAFFHIPSLTTSLAPSVSPSPVALTLAPSHSPSLAPLLLPFLSTPPSPTGFSCRCCGQVKVQNMQVTNVLSNNSPY